MHSIELWPKPPLIVPVDDNKIREAAIALLDTIEFKMSGTLDSDRRCIGYGTAVKLKALRDTIYNFKPFQDPSCPTNTNCPELPLSSSETGSTVPLSSPVAP